MIFTDPRWSSFLKRLICCIMTSWILSFRIFIPNVLMKRGDNSGNMDLHKDWVSHGQLMEEVFINIYWGDTMKHIKGDEGNWRSFNLGRQMLHAWQKFGRYKVARSWIDLNTMKGAHHWMRRLTEHTWLKVWGYHVTDEFTQCVTWLELQV
jgi:hypothetical protein